MGFDEVLCYLAHAAAFVGHDIDKVGSIAVHHHGVDAALFDPIEHFGIEARLLEGVSDIDDPVEGRKIGKIKDGKFACGEFLIIKSIHMATKNRAYVTHVTYPALNALHECLLCVKSKTADQYCYFHKM